MAVSTIKSVSSITNNHYYPLEWGTYGEGSIDKEVQLDHPLKYGVLTLIIFGVNGRNQLWTTLALDEIRELSVGDNSHIWIKVKDQNTVMVNSPNGRPLKQIVQFPALLM